MGEPMRHGQGKPVKSFGRIAQWLSFNSSGLGLKMPEVADTWLWRLGNEPYEYKREERRVEEKRLVSGVARREHTAISLRVRTRKRQATFRMRSMRRVKTNLPLAL